MKRVVWLALVGWVALAAAQPPEPDEVLQEARAIVVTAPHLHYQVAGHSSQGRDIGLILASSRPDRVEEQLRVMVLARQHGDESAPAYAALLWLRAAASRPGSFRHVAVLLVPTLNPDGAAAGTRVNGLGIDLNRDWVGRTAPETQVAAHLFNRWRPHVVLDLHTFDGLAGGRRKPDWLERFATGGEPDSIAAELQQRIVERQAAAGETMVPVVTTPGAALSLAHRHFASDYRAVALLVEIGDGRADPEARVLDLVVDELNRHEQAWQRRLDGLRSLAGWRAPRDFAPRPVAVAPAVPPRPGPPLPLSVPVAAYLLVVLAGAKFRDDLADTQARDGQ